MTSTPPHLSTKEGTTETISVLKGSTSSSASKIASYEIFSSLIAL